MSRAARRLHVSAPPLSQRLKELEDELGVTLFVRHPRGMHLSDAGARLLPRARRILAEVDAAASELRRGPGP